MGAMGFLIFIFIFLIAVAGIGLGTVLLGVVGLLFLRNKSPKGKKVFVVILSIILAFGILMTLVPVGFFSCAAIEMMLTADVYEEVDMETQEDLYLEDSYYEDVPYYEEDGM